MLYFNMCVGQGAVDRIADKIQVSVFRLSSIDPSNLSGHRLSAGKRSV